MNQDIATAFRRSSLVHQGIAHLLRNEVAQAIELLDEACGDEALASVVADARAHGTVAPIAVARLAKAFGFTHAVNYCITRGLESGGAAQGAIWWAAARELDPQEVLRRTLGALRFGLAFSAWRQTGGTPPELGVDILTRAGRLTAAAALAATLPDTAARLQRQGEIALFQGRIEEAVGYFQECATLGPANGRLGYFGFGALILAGRTAEVEALVRKTSIFTEADVLAHLAMAAAAAGDVIEAERLVAAARGHASAGSANQAELLKAFGLVAQAAGDLGTALEHHRRAAEIAPTDPMILLTLAEIQRRLGLPDTRDGITHARRLHRGAFGYLTAVARAVRGA